MNALRPLILRGRWAGPALRVLLLLLPALLVAPRPGATQPVSPSQALERFLSAETLDPDWFAPSFLEAVPFSQLAPIRAQMTEGLGKLVAIRPDGDRWLAVHEEGSLPAYVTLDETGRFVGLRLLYAIPRVRDLGAAVDAVRKLEGTVSLLVLRDGEELAGLNPDTALAVGSTFKLAVLAALQEQIGAGIRGWTEVVEIEAGRRSLPSGILQDWPDGSPLTLHSLAVLMVSISDNTATDALIRTVGREAVETKGGQRNRPFLTTREAFLLKTPEQSGLRNSFLEGDPETRRRILDDLGDAPLPDPGMFERGPMAPEIEWFFTAGELCALMDEVAGLDLFTVNPGLVSKAQWDGVAFKGGSEPGVLNLTTRLTAGEDAYCVCLTVNRKDGTVDEAAVARAYSGVVEALRSQD